MEKFRWAVFFSGWGKSANDFYNILQSYPYKSRHTLQVFITIGQRKTFLNNLEQNVPIIIDNDINEFINKTEYQSWLAEKLIGHGVNYIFLLGYKYKIRKPLLSSFPNKIFNTHPSLLPSFKNTQSAIEDAIKYGVKISGITSHIIDSNIDEGIIISQRAVTLNPDNTPESLYPKFNSAGKEVIKETLNYVDSLHPKNEQ